MKFNIDFKSPNFFLPIAAVLFLLLYLATLEPLLAVLTIASFLSYFALDLFKTTRSKDKSSVKEIIYAVVAAAVLWFILSTVLQTPSPLDVVTSCSMRPVLDRGDFIVLQGQRIYNAPIVEYRGEIPQISVLKSNCTVVRRGLEPVINECTYIVFIRNGTSDLKIPVNRNNVSNNDVIVYDSRTSGLIIHRAVALLKNADTGEMVYLTKGDNNRILDQEAGIDLVAPGKIHGATLFRIPIIGYYRLFLAGQFNEPEGCDTSVD